MKIRIDGQDITIFNEDKNIVDVAKRAKIGIPAPCYYNDRKGGCCKGCLIEINGEEKYACCTKPEDGMNIIYKRDDLDVIRKKRIKKYAMGNAEPCNCGCSSNSDCC
jgi:predicted molibdopterin-dependent oxidoreductase YjgC